MDLRLIFGLILLFLSSCSAPTNHAGKEAIKTDPNVKNQLQGTWFDKNSDSPVLKIEGDSLLYTSMSDVQMPYKLIDDTLFVHGLHTAAYPITERTEHSICFITPMGDEMCLYKNDAAGVHLDLPISEEVEVVNEVIKKDSVIMYHNTRYRGYVTINPTSIKVIRPGVTEEGFSIDNVYYDNIIHICVYQGKNQLCGKDIKRSMFEGVVPHDFLSVSILYDMDFIKVVNDGFVFRTILRVPDGPCYCANLLINKKNQIDVKLIEL